MAKRKVGRPSDYNQKTVDFICDELAEGKSLREICAPDDMPNRGAVFRWLGQNEAFHNQYARAREVQADAIFDDVLKLADDDKADVQRSRLQVDARKWIAGKLRPKKYGDKQEIDLNIQPVVIAKDAADL